MNGLWIVGIGAVIAVIYAVMVYNKMIVLRNRVDEAWSDVEVQMKRRYDLIPNLVETVKGYAKYEGSTLEKIIQARNMAMTPKANMQELAASENVLTGALKSVFALTENYPDLKANANFLDLQHELRDTEDKMQAGWRFYNGNVLALNTKIDMFPSNIVASIFHFEKREFFKLDAADAEARKAVKVQF